MKWIKKLFRDRSVTTITGVVFRPDVNGNYQWGSDIIDGKAMLKAMNKFIKRNKRLKYGKAGIGRWRRY